MPDFVSMHFGVSLNKLSLLFFGSLAGALWLLYVFCKRKFAERSETGRRDYIYQLLPRQLATPQEYSKGFLIYFGSMAAFVILLSLLGPENLGSLGITMSEKLNYITVPLAIVLIQIGALPNVPGLILMEQLLRQYAHARAFIPDAARATAQRLAAADFDFSSYQGEVLRSPEMRGVEPADFTRPRHSLEHAWARLCCLVFVQKSCRVEGVTESLDANLLQDYETDLELIESEKKSMEAQVAAYRAARANDPYYANEGLRRGIADNLHKLYILLGCAVRYKMQADDDIDLALRPLGFKLRPTARMRDTADLKIVGLTVAAASITVLGLAAAGLGWLGLWTLSDVFPKTVMQPFWDTASTLVPHATAIMLADLIRTRAINHGTWFGAAGPRRRGDDANYVRLVVACGIAGYIALVLWGLVLAPPTANSFKIELPYALLAMVTGGFYAYHLDNAESGRQRSPVWELGAQSVLTGTFGLIAACATWQMILGAASLAIDRIILTAVINATVGLALGWYVPQAAAATRYDPLVEASEERVRALETMAKVQLGDADAAIWLDKLHPALANRSPRAAAAADVAGFERAIDLLHGPHALAA